MVNYGYECKGWKKWKTQMLANALNKMLDDGDYVDEFNMQPYIEGDNPYSLYKGVRIRRITHMSEERQKKLVEEADKIYLKIQNGKNV